MISITKKEFVGGLKLDVEGLASHIYQAFEEDPCSFFIKGEKTDLVIIGDFEDIPTHLICYDFSGQYPYLIKHSYKELEGVLNIVGYIKGVFNVEIEMQVIVGNKHDIEVIN